MFVVKNMTNVITSKASVKEHIVNFTGNNFDLDTSVKSALLKCVDELDDDLNPEVCGVCMVSSGNLLNCYIGCAFKTCLKCYHKLDDPKRCPLCKQGFDEYFFKDSVMEFQGTMSNRLPNDPEGMLFYLPDGIFTFKGPVRDGKIDGPGEIEFDDNSYGFGIPFVDGKIHGIIETFVDNIYDGDEDLILKFKGEFKHGQMDNGTLYNKKRESYTGQFKDDKYHGYGITKDSKGIVKFCGYWDAGKKHGPGMDYNKKEELVYCGEYVSGKRQGYGKLYQSNPCDETQELKFEGLFDNDAPTLGDYYTFEGEVQHLARDGDTYSLSLIGDGQNVMFRGGMNNILEMHGKCVKYSRDEYVTFIGTYNSYDKRGNGTEYCNGKIVYCGDFLYNVRDGHGQLYSDGKLMYAGEFIGGEFSGKGKFIWNCGVECNATFDYGEIVGGEIVMYMPQKVCLAVSGSGCIIVGDCNSVNIYSFEFHFVMDPEADLTELFVGVNKYLAGEGESEVLLGDFAGDLCQGPETLRPSLNQDKTGGHMCITDPHVSRMAYLSPEPVLVHPNVFGVIGPDSNLMDTYDIRTFQE